jgi:MbtH protein
MADEYEDKTIYKVVLNHEEQYSIGPTYPQNALGWKDAGKSGTKAWTTSKKCGQTCVL